MPTPPDSGDDGWSSPSYGGGPRKDERRPAGASARRTPPARDGSARDSRDAPSRQTPPRQTPPRQTPPRQAPSRPSRPSRQDDAPRGSGNDRDPWSEPSYSRPPEARTTAAAGSRRSPYDPARRDGPRRDGVSPRGDVSPRDGGDTRAFAGPVDAPPRQARVPVAQPRSSGAPPRTDDDWDSAGPMSAADQRATRAAERRREQEARRTERSVEALQRQAEPKPYERGLRWWWALLVLVAITLLGALIDSLASIDSQTGFNYGIVIASILAILIVKRSDMFPIVVAPPIVYSLAALLQLYLKSSINSDKKGLIGTVLDAVQNYLVYGFPAMARATAAVLIIAGIRLITRK